MICCSAGFVGSHLVDLLMLQGHEVTVIDNFFTGRKKNVEHWWVWLTANIANPPGLCPNPLLISWRACSSFRIGHPNFELVMHDVVEPFMIEVDEIYHLASPASPPHYMARPPPLSETRKNKKNK